jgi:hypothetical protein
MKKFALCIVRGKIFSQKIPPITTSHPGKYHNPVIFAEPLFGNPRAI